MKSAIVLTLSACAAFAYPGGARVPAGNAGEPGSGTPCAACHRVTLNPSGGSAALSLPQTLTCEPGVKQSWSRRISDPDSSRRFGFQLTATAGTLSSPQGVVVTANGRPYLNQSSATATATIEWTPPATLDTPVTIYLAGAARRGASNINVYTASFILQPQPPPAPAAKFSKLLEETPVIHAATLNALIAPGAVVALRGENLTPDDLSRFWADVPAENGSTPVSLSSSLKDVRVLVNDAPAQILSVSPTRVLFLTPAGLEPGFAFIRLSAPHGETPSVSVEVAASQPALYSRPSLERRLALAYLPGGALCATAAEFADPWLGRPTPAGSQVALIATGFAADTSPDRLSVLIADQPAQVLSLEAATPGFVRITVRLPDLAPGEHPVKLSLDGTPTAPEPLLPVSR
jgi:uncharacterized protein (TIGR03437 family)